MSPWFKSFLTALQEANNGELKDDGCGKIPKQAR